MSTSLTKHLTADELLAMPDDGYRYELVKGELIRMSPTGHEHGVVTVNLTAPLAMYVKANRLGVIAAAETGFKLERNPDTVRAPDISFVSRERYEKAGRTPKYWSGAPDLAVEVMSPDDRARKVDAKVAEWLRAGAKLVWIVSPKHRTITIHRATKETEVLTEQDQLDGEDVIPGFRISVAEIFAG